MSKEKSPVEIREEFLNHIRSLINYWSEVETTEKDKLEGLAFSILAALDGSSADLPAFIVAPYPHKDDKQYHIDRGEDYYPEAPDVPGDIAGGLHELFYQ